MLTIPCPPRPDTVDAYHANFVYGATASNAPIPAGYSVFDNNTNIPFGIYGAWSAAHSKFHGVLANLVSRPGHELVSRRAHTSPQASLLRDTAADTRRYQ